jgi:hypothetical protein
MSLRRSPEIVKINLDLDKLSLFLLLPDDHTPLLQRSATLFSLFGKTRKGTFSRHDIFKVKLLINVPITVDNLVTSVLPGPMIGLPHDTPIFLPVFGTASRFKVRVSFGGIANCVVGVGTDPKVVKVDIRVQGRQ